MNNLKKCLNHEKTETKNGVVPKLRFPEFRGGAGWERNELGQIGYFTGGGTPSKANESFWQGSIPWVSSSDIEEESVHSFDINRYITEEALNDSATKLVPANSILLVSRVGVGKLAITKQTLCTSQDFTNFTPTEGCLEFFAYFLKMRSNLLLSFSQGMAIKGFTKDDISKLNINLPKPPEQQRIADCLSSLDSLIAAHSQKLDGLKSYKKGLMQQLFPAKGEKVPKLRFPEFRKSGEWDVDILEQLAKFRRGSFPQPYGLPDWYDDENGIPFVQVFDVGDNLCLKEKTKNKISKLGAEQSIFIEKGTLIVTLQGSIGRVAITQYDAYIDRTLLIFEDFYKPTDKLFFAYIIQMLFEIEKEKAPGGIIKTITKEALSSFEVKLPTFLEQQRIASFLSSIDNLITAQSQKIESLKTFKKGLMQQLFPTMEDVAV